MTPITDLGLTRREQEQVLTVLYRAPRWMHEPRAFQKERSTIVTWDEECRDMTWLSKQGIPRRVIAAIYLTNEGHVLSKLDYARPRHVSKRPRLVGPRMR